MFITDLFVAFIVATMLSALLLGVFEWRHPIRPASWHGGLFLFLLLLLVTWAGGLWLVPVGPELWGVAWLSFLIMGLLAAMIIIAIAVPVTRPPRPGAGRGSPRDVRATAETPADEVRTDVETAVASVFGMFFWILVVALGAAIIIKYAVG